MAAMSCRMNLSSEQQAIVRKWAAEGATLNDIQNKLREELDISMTYMETRLLLIDLDAALQDTEEEAAERKAEESQDDAQEAFSEHALEPEEPGNLGAGKVKVTLDELTIPGTVASGNVTFSDGKSLKWYLDQMGRLGLQGGDSSYQPPKDDVPAFQRQLQALLSRF